ncbi:arylsulfotransferase family protein [uncultured Friedmanniella sp.]|uniref:arylsulfotransferase family protein n=1 Tax=uncultured Friedmanniella sp. TaxID=335381 RepID=UPI0035CBB0D0
MDPEPTTSTTPRSARRFSRRRALVLTGGGLAGLVGAGTVTDLAAGDPVRRAIKATASSSPSAAATPAAFTVVTLRAGVAPGDIFLTDMGSTPATVIADPSGTVLWTAGGAKSYADLRTQTYQGKPALTYWESNSSGLAAYANGRDVVTDLEHHVIATIETHAGISPDEHEFRLTPRGTALITSYVTTTGVDLRHHGGVKNGVVMNGIAKEIDLATGKVLLHWESLDHVALSESHAGVPDDPTEPWDYCHINSVNTTPDGNLVISARHTWAVYKVARDTGRVLWRLGGKKSDFAVPSAARFAWQHDAEFEAANELRIFDNASDGTVKTHARSRILWLSLDETRRRATLVRRFQHPDLVQADAMGNAQRLANGNVFVGWGTAKRVTEFSPTGEVLFDATLPDVSYRGYRQVWR